MTARSLVKKEGVTPLWVTHAPISIGAREDDPSRESRELRVTRVHAGPQHVDLIGLGVDQEVWAATHEVRLRELCPLRLPASDLEPRHLDLGGNLAPLVTRDIFG